MYDSIVRTVRFATAAAMMDFRDGFRRSPLGTLWRSLGVFTMILVLGVFFGAILKGNLASLHEYILSLAAGILAWDYLSSCLNQSCSTFGNQAQTLRHTSQPLAGIFLRICIRNIVLLAQSTCLAVLLYVAILGEVPAISTSLIPGVLLIGVTLYPATLLIGIACIRYRDLPQFVSWASHLCFLLTPILWPTYFLGRYQYLAEWNPTYHLVELYRAPLLGAMPTATTWAVSVCLACAFAIVAGWLYRRLEDRIPYWLRCLARGRRCLRTRLDPGQRDGTDEQSPPRPGSGPIAHRRTLGAGSILRGTRIFLLPALPP